MAYSLGIDVGSTTVKTVIIDDNKKIIYSKYERHFSKVRETVEEQLKIIEEKYPGSRYHLSITGSAGLGLANAADLPFVQEVFGAFIAVKESYPDADAVIELGGEDAKIIFLTGGTEQRMNGSCAGGTGAFIDQMASLLGISVDEMDRLSLESEKLYPIASRCGVFAKSDIQPLLNQGADHRDVAASIFQAVVDQTVSGLAQGRKISGKVLFLGGPLFFLKGLRKRFIKTLELSEENAVFPEHASCFMAYGSALYAMENTDEYSLGDVIEKVKNAPVNDDITTGVRLFKDEQEYAEFTKRHSACDVERLDIKSYSGDAYLGIDAGSTTTKLVLISPEGKLIYSFYASNKGQPIDVVSQQMKLMYELSDNRINIVSSAVTGYGEELIRSAMGIDHGIVETVAHYKAASFFCPSVDFIIDIGGQDIKCFKIRNGAIDSIMLNEACSSGCGSFIQTFAQALGYDIAEFSKLGLFAERPVDLGSRCTVFMNSSVKQAQKDGASVEDISAGLSSSIIKNAIYKVIRARSADELGENIVVQGGTFLNDAVLRSFEIELNRNVTRPSIAGLMGAFGAALYAKENAKEKSTVISAEKLKDFSYTSRQARCGKCGSNCSLTVISFNDGRKMISGNRCEKGAGLIRKNNAPCMYEYKYAHIMECMKSQPENPKAKIGLPMVLNYYEQLPFWHKIFETLGFETVISSESSRAMYYKGQQTIPSDTVCYPAKLAHGHIIDLLEKNVDLIFYPCESYNIDEGHSDNHYNCPVVAYYPELLKANIPELTDSNFLLPYVDINLERHCVEVLVNAFGEKYGVTKKQAKEAFRAGHEALKQYRDEIIEEGQRVIKEARFKNMPIIVISGRPYHIDPEINHGIHKLMTTLGLAVITEDSVAHLAELPKLNVLNQWSYHSRLYRAAQYVTTQPDMELVQLISFGCGIDAITSDEVRSILENGGKLYTQLKIDEISNLGAAKIRLRSLVAAMETKKSSRQQ